MIKHIEGKGYCVLHAHKQKEGSKTDKPAGSIIKCFDTKEEAMAMHQAIIISQQKDEMDCEFSVDRGQYEVIETSEGFLKARVTIAKVGVFPYIQSDGSIRYEAKLPEELLSAKTVSSAKGVPSTNEHPIKNNKYILVDTDNYKEFTVGSISEPVADSDSIIAFETIYDKNAIDKIKVQKHKEVSIGFTYEIDETPGVWNGIPYDVVQRNIKINHVAHVEHGRGGKDVKIHVDKGEGMQTNNQNSAAPAGNSTGDTMYSFRCDNGNDISVPKNVHDELMTMKKKIQTDSIELENLKKQLSDVHQKNEFDTMKAAVDEWKNKYQELSNSIPGMVADAAKNRIDLMNIAKSTIVDQNFDSMSDKEIKLKVIEKGLPFKSNVDTSKVSDIEINTRFDAAVEIMKYTANNKQKTGIDENIPKNGIQNLYNNFGGQK